MLTLSISNFLSSLLKLPRSFSFPSCIFSILIDLIDLNIMEYSPIHDRIHINLLSWRNIIISHYIIHHYINLHDNYQRWSLQPGSHLQQNEGQLQGEALRRHRFQEESPLIIKSGLLSHEGLNFRGIEEWSGAQYIYGWFWCTLHHPQLNKTLD